MITSLTNKRIKDVKALCAKPALRRQRRCFVAEGLRLFGEIPEGSIEELYMTGSFLEACPARLLEKARACGFEEVSEEVLRKMSDTASPQGVLAVVRMPEHTLEELAGREDAALMVLEQIRDPGNLGTILRSCEGAGITGVIMDRGTVDVFNPKTVRATMGSLLRVPFVYADDLVQVLDLLRSRGIASYAAHLDGKTDYDREDYRGGSAFLIGNEANGLSSRLTEAADRLVRIPMQGRLESLNASVAASVLAFELARQRRAANA